MTTQKPPPGAPPPGWYPDPSGQPQTRWWDGSQWTSATQFAGTPARRSSTALVVGLAVGSVLVVLALLAGAVMLVRGSVATGTSDVLAGEQSGVGQGAVDGEGYIEHEVETGGGVTAAGPCLYRSTGDEERAAPPAEQDVARSGEHQVVLDTSQGRIAFVVDAARVPCTLAALRALAAADYYDGSPCHRLTTQGIFVLQCGDPTGTGTGGPGWEFDDEALDDLPTDAAYPRGTVAMANSGPDTNGSQFFLVYRDGPLPPNYTVLGRITDGLDVLERVAEAGVEDDRFGNGDGSPRTPVELRDVQVSPS